MVRCVLAIINKYDLNACQLDVKTAFLNGTLNEEIFMTIPQGSDYPTDVIQQKVCKLKRALYGLRISSKRWFIRLSTILYKAGLKNDQTEPCLFYIIDAELILILIFYVDDILIAGNNQMKMNEIINELQNAFEITNLGEPVEFLGITINRNRSKRILELNQSKYIEKILTRFGFDQVNPKRTPMVTTKVATKERKVREDPNDAETLNETLSKINAPYREAVGSLLYLANASRCDITFAVNVLSRHQVNPTKDDWDMVKRVFCYLKATKNLCLTFRGRLNDMQLYSDASFADCLGSRTTCGYVIRLFGDSVAWRTHKQTYVALSTCQAEYVAMSEACQEAVALSKSLNTILNRSFYPMLLWCDNKAAEACTKTDSSTKLRHMVDVREDYVKQCLELGLITIRWISSKNQVADIFTKPLSFELHERLTNEILNETKHLRDNVKP